MDPMPSASLLGWLKRLGRESAVRSGPVLRCVRRNLKDLPPLDSIWIDALAQTGQLTYYQAERLHAGQGEDLFVDRFVIQRKLADWGYAECFLALHTPTGSRAALSQTRFDKWNRSEVKQQLEELMVRSAKINHDCIAPIERVGIQQGFYWTTARYFEGESIAERMVRTGRMSGDDVNRIARQMAAGLVQLEKVEMIHGDIRAWRLLIDRRERVSLSHGGLRPIARPYEGFSVIDIAPEILDGLSPERIDSQSAPSTADDIYACGYLWWTMLAGRSPAPGGNSLTKLKALRGGQFGDIRETARDAPADLVDVIGACLESDPERRPSSMRAVAEMLGTPDSRCGKLAVRRLFTKKKSVAPIAAPVSHHSIWRRPAPVMAATVVATVLIGMAALNWRPDWPLPVAQMNSSDPPMPTEKKQLKSTDPPKRNTDSNHNKKTKQVEHSNDSLTIRQIVRLPSDRMVRLRSLRLEGGAIVRAAPGQRSSVVVPPGGLKINVTGVQFIDIDFIAPRQLRSDISKPSPGGMIVVGGSDIEFLGCSFQSAWQTGDAPIAICLQNDWRQNNSSLQNGHIRLRDCVFRGVQAAIANCRSGTLLLECENTLHLGPGSLMLFRAWPVATDVVVLKLNRLTLRGAGSLVRCASFDDEQNVGSLHISAIDCAFVPKATGGLFSFTGKVEPDRLLREIRWEGEGSLLASGSPVARWSPPGKVATDLDDARMSIAGLVRGKAKFAATRASQPADCEILEWQAPLRTQQSPGADVHRLNIPKLMQ